MSNFVDDLNDLDLQATLVKGEDPAEAEKMWKRALEMNHLEFESRPDPNLHYDRGYFEYMIWAHTGHDFAASESSLRACLAAWPGHELARFYLGCLYFESGDNARGYETFETMRPATRDYFISIDQEWRYIKVLEFMLSIACVDERNSDILVLLKEWKESITQLEEPYYILPITIVGKLEALLKRDVAPEWLPMVCQEVADVVAMTRSEVVIRKHFTSYSDTWLPEEKGKPAK